MALFDLKMAVLELVPLNDRNYISHRVPIARKWHRLIGGEKMSTIHDIEQQTSCTMRLPSPETGSEFIEIFGPASQVVVAAVLASELVPIEVAFSIPTTQELRALLEGRDWKDFVDRLQNDLHIATVIVPGMGTNPAEVKLCCPRNVESMLHTTWALIQDHLRSNRVPLVVNAFPSRRRSGSDSFGTSFSPMPSRHMSNQTGEAEPNMPQRQPMRRLRAAASTSDVKALFNGSQNAFSQMSLYPSANRWGSVPEDDELQSPAGPLTPITPTSQVGPPRVHVNVHSRNRSDFSWPSSSGFMKGYNNHQQQDFGGQPMHDHQRLGTGLKRSGRHASMDLRSGCTYIIC